MINEEVYLECPRLRLIPYFQHHVPRYHEWMSDPALLAATESEPLSLEHEYANQRSWLHATDKLTFILAAPFFLFASEPSTRAGAELPAVASKRTVLADAHEGGAVTPLREFVVERNSIPASFFAEQRGGGSRCKEAFPLISSEDNAIFMTELEDGCSVLGSTFPCAARTKPLPVRYAPSHARNLFDGEAVEARSASPTGCETFVMIGDCNLFLLEEAVETIDDGVGNSGGTRAVPGSSSTCRKEMGQLVKCDGAWSWLGRARTFEVEVMIACEFFRRRGLGEVAVRMLMQYAVAVLGATDFVAKILEDNHASIQLFVKKLGFAEMKRVPVFGEIHFARSLRSPAEKRKWKEECDAAGCGSGLCGPYNAHLEQSMLLLSHVPPS